jgi:hypothetical protein
MRGGINKMILGMDLWVFTAWLGTIFASVLCVAYGVYQEFVKPQKKQNTTRKSTNTKRREVG